MFEAHPSFDFPHRTSDRSRLVQRQPQHDSSPRTRLRHRQWITAKDSAGGYQHPQGPEQRKHPTTYRSLSTAAVLEEVSVVDEPLSSTLEGGAALFPVVELGEYSAKPSIVCCCCTKRNQHDWSE